VLFRKAQLASKAFHCAVYLGDFLRNHQRWFPLKAASVVRSLSAVAVVSLGSSVSNFFTAPVTHQDQGRSRKRSKPRPGGDRPFPPCRGGPENLGVADPADGAGVKTCGSGNLREHRPTFFVRFPGPFVVANLCCPRPSRLLKNPVGGPLLL
jgi:hypothetical protein